MVFKVVSLLGLLAKIEVLMVLELRMLFSLELWKTVGWKLDGCSFNMYLFPGYLDGSKGANSDEIQLH